jgi:hypothetical protein
MAKMAQRQYLVRISGIEGYWATFSGGNITADTNKVYDGGNPVPEVLAGPSEADNITVGRPYDTNRDATMLENLRRRVGVFTATISVQPTDRNYNVIGKPRVFPNALLVSLTEPEYDATSGDAAQVELEFAVGAYV